MHYIFTGPVYTLYRNSYEWTYRKYLACFDPESEEAKQVHILIAILLLHYYATGSIKSDVA